MLNKQDSTISLVQRTSLAMERESQNIRNTTEEETPLLLGEAQHKSSNMQSMFHIICVIAGTGMLQIPYALAQSGWIGVLMLCGSAWVNHYSGLLLAECLYTPTGRLKGYPDIGRVAYGKAGQYFVQVFYNAAMLGTACLYFILIGMNLTELTGYLQPEKWTVCIALILIIPFIFQRTLKEVAIASFSGALASLIIVIIVVSVSIWDFSNYEIQVSHELINLRSFGTVMGTFSFSFGGNYVYPEVHLY